MNEVLLHKAGLTVNCILKPPKERREEPVRQAEKKKAKTKKMEVSPRFSPWMAYPGDYNSGLQVSVEPQAGGHGNAASLKDAAKFTTDRIMPFRTFLPHTQVPIITSR